MVPNPILYERVKSRDAIYLYLMSDFITAEESRIYRAGGWVEFQRVNGETLILYVVVNMVQNSEFLLVTSR